MMKVALVLGGASAFVTPPHAARVVLGAANDVEPMARARGVHASTLLPIKTARGPHVLGTHALTCALCAKPSVVTCLVSRDRRTWTSRPCSTSSRRPHPSSSTSNDSSDLKFRWRLRLAETVSGEEDGECSGEPRTARVVGTLHSPNRAGNDRVTSR